MIAAIYTVHPCARFRLVPCRPPGSLMAVDRVLDCLRIRCNHTPHLDGAGAALLASTGCAEPLRAQVFQGPTWRPRSGWQSSRGSWNEHPPGTFTTVESSAGAGGRPQCEAVRAH